MPREDINTKHVATDATKVPRHPTGNPQFYPKQTSWVGTASSPQLPAADASLLPCVSVRDSRVSWRPNSISGKLYKVTPAFRSLLHDAAPGERALRLADPPRFVSATSLMQPCTIVHVLLVVALVRHGRGGRDQRMAAGALIDLRATLNRIASV